MFKAKSSIVSNVKVADGILCKQYINTQVRLLPAQTAFSGSGTPRPKTISARDSSAQIDFFTGTPPTFSSYS